MLKPIRTPTPFTKPRPRVLDAAAEEERERLLRSKISELGLRVEGSRLEPLVKQLHRELDDVGIVFKPRVYLSDEWGCPDGVPLIGVPFYLADERLTLLQKELLDAIEAERDEEILAYLRHEAGHALNYAYRLYETEEWHSVFGPYSRPYLDDYAPDPFSRSFVRHIPGWYAQKHPDEDFAETFAVWLTPGSDWRRTYADWSCVKKLEYVERTLRRIGPTQPPLPAAAYDESLDLARGALLSFRSKPPPSRRAATYALRWKAAGGRCRASVWSIESGRGSAPFVWWLGARAFGSARELARVECSLFARPRVLACAPCVPHSRAPTASEMHVSLRLPPSSTPPPALPTLPALRSGTAASTRS